MQGLYRARIGDEGQQPINQSGLLIELILREATSWRRAEKVLVAGGDVIGPQVAGVGRLNGGQSGGI